MVGGIIPAALVNILPLALLLMGGVLVVHLLLEDVAVVTLIMVHVLVNKPPPKVATMSQLPAAAAASIGMLLPAPAAPAEHLPQPEQPLHQVEVAAAVLVLQAIIGCLTMVVGA